MASKLVTILSSSVVKKQIMGVSGLLLCGFLVGHLIGNCLIYVGDEAFNRYGHALITNPLIYVAEAGLAALFLTHIGLAVRLTIENYKARPQKYYLKQHRGGGANFASSTMPYTGFLILVFMVTHLINFKFGPSYTNTYGGVEMRDLYRTVVEYFQSPAAVVWYIFCMIGLGIHLSHGFWSAFQSLGINHPRYNGFLKKFSLGFAIVIAGGYTALPIYCYLIGMR
jgi:succinate dehydrogenase / fumarate reductase cytochrome b subunit